MNELLSIGHSNHSIDTFIALLRQHGVTAVGDVRSHPYSRHFPQYSRDALQASLARADIAYVFLGKELGARSTNPACYRNGKARYELLAREPAFSSGLDRLRAGMARFRVAVMCAEKDPLECHRAVLVGHQMHATGTPVQHIHADGNLEEHAAMETRMLALLKMSGPDMFRSRDEILEEAYAIRGEQIAYQDEAMLREDKNERKTG